MHRHRHEQVPRAIRHLDPNGAGRRGYEFEIVRLAVPHLNGRRTARRLICRPRKSRNRSPWMSHSPGVRSDKLSLHMMEVIGSPLRRAPFGWWDLLDIVIVSLLIYELLILGLSPKGALAPA